MSALLFNSVTLTIRAADEASEIFLIDAGLSRIASGVGRLKIDVDPGIYKVRFRSGASQHDELVEISGLDENVVVQGPPILFHTAAPIDKTLTTHEYHSGPATMLSKQVNCEIGYGGELFIFVREEEGDQIQDQEFSVSGVTVHSLDGMELATFEQGDVDIQYRWSAITLRLDPGTYSIRVASGPIGTYEIFVTISQGWQTQVFMVMDEFWHDRISFRAPSLRSASVLMSHQGRGFDPYSRTVRLAELARHALEQGRNVISSQLMNELLSEKFEDPMLGIIAAHLIMRRHRPNWDLLLVVINNLANMLGEHPDVQALQIAMKKKSVTRIDSISSPPLLRNSWDYITKASRRRASLVSLDSHSARIANDVVSGGPWLIHRINEGHQFSSTDNFSIAESMRVVEKLMSMEPEQFTTIIKQTRSDDQSFSGLERGVLGAVSSYVQFRNLESGDAQISELTKARQVLSDLSAPSQSIANAVISLSEKMKLG